MNLLLSASYPCCFQIQYIEMKTIGPLRNQNLPAIVFIAADICDGLYSRKTRCIDLKHDLSGVKTDTFFRMLLSHVKPQHVGWRPHMASTEDIADFVTG
jgi:hypothetical protein